MTSRSAALALMASVFWGGNLVALKLGLTIFAPLWNAWWRFALGSVVIGGWARWEGVSLNPHRRELRPLVTLSALFTLQIVLLNVGANMTSPAYAVVILNAHPVFSNLIGHFVATEQRLTGTRVAGLALAFGGICFLAMGRPVAALASDPLLGNWLLVVSSVLLSVRTVYTRRLVQSIDPLRTVVWQGLGSLPVFLLGGLLLEPALLEPLAWAPVMAMIYQGVIVAGFCFIVWTRLLRRHSAGTVAMFGFTVPFFGILLSALMFNEPISGRILVAAGLVTVGIAIVTLSKDKRRPV